MKICLEPGASFKTRGIAIPSISEADVADIVIKACSDALEEFGIEHDRLFSPLDKIGVGQLAIQIAVGYDETQKSKNWSLVEGSSGISARMAEVLSEWGRCCSFGHQVKTREGCESSRVRLVLFALNGQDSEQYLCRLTPLGRELAQAIADFTTAFLQARREKQGEAPAKIPDSLRCIFDCA